MPISEATYRKVALEDPEGHWELECGRLRRKPDMTAAHNEIAIELAFQLRQQLDRATFRVRHENGHVRLAPGSYYIPDVSVIPTELVLAQLPSRALEVYDAPLPLVAEIWSASTGEYDLATKLQEYQRRGDLEIWLIHPYEQTLTAWVRQRAQAPALDGNYAESRHTSGPVYPAALPGVVVDLDALFA